MSEEFNLRRLPFMRWDLPFERDESFHSWFARTVGQNGDESVADFNAVRDISPYTMRPEDALRKVKRLPLPKETLERMEWATVVKQKDAYGICGQRVRFSDLTFRRPRWCPACIAEKPYRRIWFDFLHITRCPYHGDEIVSHDSEGNQLPWYTTDFSHGTDGVPLGRPATDRKLRVGGLGHYILGRLGLEEPMVCPMLDRLELIDVLPACEMLGAVAKGDIVPELESVELGFLMLKGTHAELAEAMRPIVRRSPDAGARGRIKDVFGRAYESAGQRLRPKMRKIIVRAMEEAISAELSPKSFVISERDVASRRVTTMEVEDRFGIAASTVAKVAKVIGVHRFKKRKPLIEADVPAIVEFVGNLLSRREAADHLNISPHAMDALVKDGGLRRFINTKIGNFEGPRFHIPDLDAMLSTLDEIPLTGNVLLAKPFHAFTLGKRGLQHGDLAVKVLRGEVKVAGRKPGVHGFRSLVIETGKMTKRPRVTADPNWLSLAHVQALLNIRKETIWELMAMGLLVPEGQYVRLHAFRRDDVENIQRTYARSMDFCGGLGITKYRLRDLMVAAGVQPLIRSDKRHYVDTIYEKASVIEALGLTRDPTVASDSRLLEFWEQLKATAKARFPGLLFSDRPMAGGQTVGMTTRLSVLPITYDLGTRTVRTVVAPAAKGPVFEFDLDAKDWSSELDGLFTMLLEREDEFLKRRSDYQKDKRREAREAHPNS